METVQEKLDRCIELLESVNELLDKAYEKHKQVSVYLPDEKKDV